MRRERDSGSWSRPRTALRCPDGRSGSSGSGSRPRSASWRSSSSSRPFPSIRAARSYSLTNPCAGTDNVGPNCGERLEFNSSWESRVTIAWSSPPQPQTVITPCFLATNGSATLVGSTGSYTFISLGGTTACSFGGVAGEPTQVTVTIVRPIL